MTSNIYSHIISTLDESQLFYSKEPFTTRKKYHYLYLITNTLNGRFYIGIHSTTDLNDRYDGSGKMLHQAYQKYGKDVFTMQRVAYFKSRNDLSTAEGLVVNQSLLNEHCGRIYNLVVGGGNTEDVSKNCSDIARLVNMKPVGGSYEKDGPIAISFECTQTAARVLGMFPTSIQSAIREQYRCCLLYWRFLSKEEINEYKHIYNPDQNSALVKNLIESYQQQKDIIHSREARTARIKAQAKPPTPIGGSYELNGDVIVCFEGSRICTQTLGIGKSSYLTSIQKKCRILGIYWRYITPEEVDKHRDVYNLPREHELIQSIINSRKPRKSKKDKE